MPTGILAQERALYEEMWSGVESYGANAPGENYLPLFLARVQPKRGTTVLDAGTGSGKGAVALAKAGFEVRLCDVTKAGLIDEAKALPFYEACLWHDLSRVTMNFGQWGRTAADYAYCTDVLEHIPPQFTMLAIDQLLRVTRHALFLAISLQADEYGVWVGKALHQSVFPYTWWRDAISEVGHIVEGRDLIHDAVFWVRPR